MRDVCPHCDTDLQGDPIPKDQTKYYGTVTHYSRRIGLYDSDRDRTFAWQCPDCHGVWPR